MVETSMFMTIAHKCCPTCGTSGKLWNREPEAFVCPKCSTFFSKFGVLLEPDEDMDEVWT